VRKATTAAVKLDPPFASDADDQLVLRQVVDISWENHRAEIALNEVII
jgi:hypothetical protein